MIIIKHLLLFFFIILIPPTFVCSSQTTTLLGEFYSSLNAGNFEKSYSLLSSNDQKQINIDDFKGKTVSDQMLNQTYWALVKHIIVSIRNINGKSMIDVELTAPNLGELLGEEIGQNLIKINTLKNRNIDFDLEERNRILLNKLINRDFQYITFTETVQILLEDNQMKVYLNLEMDNKIDELIQQALAYGKDKKNDLAIEKLTKALALDPNNIIANQYMDIMLKETK